MASTKKKKCALCCELIKNKAYLNYLIHKYVDVIHDLLAAVFIPKSGLYLSQSPHLNSTLWHDTVQ